MNVKRYVNGRLTDKSRIKGSELKRRAAVSDKEDGSAPDKQA